MYIQCKYRVIINHTHNQLPYDGGEGSRVHSFRNINSTDLIQRGQLFFYQSTQIVYQQVYHLVPEARGR